MIDMNKVIDMHKRVFFYAQIFLSFFMLSFSRVDCIDLSKNQKSISGNKIQLFQDLLA